MSTPTPPQTPEPTGAPSTPESPTQAMTTPLPSASPYSPASPTAPQQYTPAYSSQPPAQQAPGQPYVGQPAPAKPQLATTMGETNTFAVLAFIFAFLSPLVGIILGHMALGQIKRTGDAGRGLGLTGLILSYAYFVFIALFFIVYIGIIVMMFGAMGAAFSSEMSGLDSGMEPYDF